MATNFSVKIGEICLFTFIRRPGIPKRWSGNLVTSCSLVNFGPVIPEFKRVKGVHPLSVSSLATSALLLDLAGIGTEFFSGLIINQFGFTHTLEGYDARDTSWLCHAFLVLRWFCFLFGRFRIRVIEIMRVLPRSAFSQNFWAAFSGETI